MHVTHTKPLQHVVWIKRKPSQTAASPEERSKTLVSGWFTEEFNHVAAGSERTRLDALGEEIPSCLELLQQALLHLYFRSSNVYLFITAPGTGSLALGYAHILGRTGLALPS